APYGVKENTADQPADDADDHIQYRHASKFVVSPERIGDTHNQADQKPCNDISSCHNHPSLRQQPILITTFNLMQNVRGLYPKNEGLMNFTLFEAYSRIQQRIHNIRKQIRDGKEEDHHHHHRLHQRDVLAFDGGGHQPTQPRIAEHVFDHDQPADQPPERDGDHRNGRQKGIAQHVFENYLAL